MSLTIDSQAKQKTEEIRPHEWTVEQKLEISKKKVSHIWRVKSFLQPSNLCGKHLCCDSNPQHW